MESVHTNKSDTQRLLGENKEIISSPLGYDEDENKDD